MKQTRNLIMQPQELKLKRTITKKRWHYTNENKNNCCKSEDD